MTRPRRPDFAVVSVAALDVRRRPDHASEMRSQLLMGEEVRVLRRDAADRWALVEHVADGYQGWARSWGLTPMPPERRACWRRLARARPVPPWLEVRDAPGSGALVTPLFWGSRVIAGRRRGAHRRVELPDGTGGWVVSDLLATGARAPRSLRERVRDLMGVPYLWGGRTPAGLDCSGLAQLLLAEQGIRLPRDAGDQERACRRLHAGEPVRPGDLAFFGPRRGRATHVGILLGAGVYVHARGRVMVNAIDSSNALFDNVLAAQFRGFRRPRRASPAGS